MTMNGIARVFQSCLHGSFGLFCFVFLLQAIDTLIMRISMGLNVLYDHSHIMISKIENSEVSVNSPIIAESAPFLLQVRYRLLYSRDYIMHW